MDKRFVREALLDAKGMIARQRDLGKGQCGPRLGDGTPIKGVGVYHIDRDDCSCAGLRLEEATEAFEPAITVSFTDPEYKLWMANQLDAFKVFVKANGIPRYATAGGGGSYSDYLADIAAWNDEPQRTKQDVLDAFDRALEAVDAA